MNLTTISINNFRSIENLRIDFEQGTQILLGINESGKSNILKAIQTIDPETNVSIEDLRIGRSDQADVESGLIRFTFTLSDDEFSEVFAKLASSVSKHDLERPFMQKGSIQLTLREFCRLRSEGLYETVLPSGDRRGTFWQVPKGHFEIVPGWVRSGATSIEVADNGVLRTLPPYTFAFLPDSAPTGLKPITPESANITFGSELGKFITNNLPRCIFWKYADSYLLPSSIEITAFADNPNTCLPLKAMFELAGIPGDEIGETIKESRAKAPRLQRYFNLLKRVADASSKQLQRVWTDHKTLRFEFQSDGGSLIPLVTNDSVSLDMASRSDGFKRLVSFLLMVSAKVETAELKDVILLFDEPEIALHPGGARSLMNELLEIGITNKVVYSTHSIFMVDPSTVGRHWIVERKSEVTDATRATKSHIQDEEVLYAAMGYSIFESLKMKNVIFEGWRDKEIYRIASAAYIKANKEAKDELGKIGGTFAEGVKDVKNVARFLELAQRGCLIISDADSAAATKRKEYAKIGSWGKWLTLKDVIGPEGPTTGEDFITRAALIKRANKFRTQITGAASLTEKFFNPGEPSISGLRRWLTEAGSTGETLDQQLNDLKSALFTDLKAEELTEDAERLVKFILAYDFTKS